MKYLQIEVWIQIATSLAIILGLGLVTYEMRLTRQIAFTDMTQEAMTEMSRRQTAIYGEEAAETLARACLTPHELSNADKVILEAVFTSQLQFAIRIKLLEDTGGINTIWDSQLRGIVNVITGYPQGERWMQLGSQLWDAEFSAVVADELQSPPELTCRERMAFMEVN